ncbi:MAG TPA: thioesterase domain-containing protein [Rhizobiaceae bacterium]|nr:thioesterase domain-containing protein [Rhizobiaceae bacterium]
MRFSMSLALAVLVALTGTSGAVADGMRPTDYVRPDGSALVRSRQDGDIYLLRGFADVFSRGLDELGRKLEQKGIRVHVIGHAAWEAAAADIARNQKQGHRPVILIGHSLGANAAILIAKRLRKENIAVQYLVTLAATTPDPVPDNVGKVDNYYFETNGWGEKVVGGAGFHGEIDNKDYSQAHDVGHFNIDKQADIQEQVIRNVLRYIQPSKGKAAS